MEPLFRLEDISVRRGETWACKNIAMTLRRGTRYCLTGPNGSGKSSLLMTIAGILSPTGGEIRRYGEAPRYDVAYLPQELSLPTMPFSVEEVVRLGAAGELDGLGRTERRRRIAEALDRFGVGQLYERSYQKLSGGERRRVALARCQIQSPTVMLLDEPLASVEPDFHLRIASALSAPVILASTHHPDVFTSLGWKRLEMEAGVLRVAG